MIILIFVLFICVIALICIEFYYLTDFFYEIDLHYAKRKYFLKKLITSKSMNYKKSLRILSEGRTFLDMDSNEIKFLTPDAYRFYLVRVSFMMQMEKIEIRDLVLFISGIEMCAAAGQLAGKESAFRKVTDEAIDKIQSKSFRKMIIRNRYYRGGEANVISEV